LKYYGIQNVAGADYIIEGGGGFVYDKIEQLRQYF
jgi:hypothetical protein